MHEGLVCRLNRVFPIEVSPGVEATTIQRGIVNGYSVIVSKDRQIGDLGIFFLGGDTQLSRQFAEVNDLLVQRHPDTGKKIGGGYLEENCRITTMKFLGVRSEGLFCPFDTYNFLTSVTELKEGDLIDHIGDIQLSQRYVPPIRNKLKVERINTRERQKQERGYSISRAFIQHFRTMPLRHMISKIPIGAILYLTIKLHGTSGRTGRILVEERKSIPIVLKWWQLVLQFLRIKTYPKTTNVTEKGYKLVTGTHYGILKKTGEDWYHGGQYRKYLEDKYFKDVLRKGEVFYYEIVGFTEKGNPIQSFGGLSKEMKKSYNSPMHFSYGCAPSECDLYVYRIIQTNEDGQAVELSWPQVKARCKELGIKHVPEIAVMPRRIYLGYVPAVLPPYVNSDALINLCEDYCDVRSILDPNHIEEGVCIRVESEEGIQIFKYKGFEFRRIESASKDNNSYEDAEEASQFDEALSDEQPEDSGGV